MSSTCWSANRRQDQWLPQVRGQPGKTSRKCGTCCRHPQCHLYFAPEVSLDIKIIILFRSEFTFFNVQRQTKTAKLPSKLKRLATARRRALPEKRLVPGKILHGPVTRVFDNPKIALKIDEKNVTRCKVLLLSSVCSSVSPFVSPKDITTLSGFCKSQSKKYPNMAVRMAVVGTAS